MSETAMLERAWWRRAARVLVAPREVFAAFRNDTPEAAEAREEPIVAVLLLGSFSAVLGTTAAGHLLDDPEYDALLIVVWAIVAAAIYAAAAYFLVGALLYGGIRVAGGEPHGYRRARHLLAYASAPLVVSLVIWPIRVSIYGEDLFRRGGADGAAGNAAFEVAETAFLVWVAALVVVGVRTVHDWSWPRAAAAAAPALAAPALVVARAYGLL